MRTVSVSNRIQELLDVVNHISERLEDAVRTDRVRHKERTISHDAHGANGVLGVDVDCLGVGAQGLHQDAEMINLFRHGVLLSLFQWFWFQEDRSSEARIGESAPSQ